MRQRSSATFHFGCALAVIGAAALAYGISSRPAAHERAPEAANSGAAETVVIRSDTERAMMAMKLRVAEDTAAADRALFIPALTYVAPSHQQAAAEARSAPIVAAAAPMPPRRPAPQMQLASIAAKPAIPAHSLTRPGAVLNDAQISSIKRRLNLTPEQERMWPSVEAALRNLSYAKAQHGGRDAAQAVASIDPNSADVQNLKSAAMPLVMSFSGDQMRELQSISRVAGLDKLVPNF
jgi:hypothetical protein